MDQTEQTAIVLKLMDSLGSRDSWCGETHIQKCIYLVQESLRATLGFEFVLYKHGPYSFDLHDLLGEMRADLLIDREPRPVPYGPTLKPSKSGIKLLKRHIATTAPYTTVIATVADKFGGRDTSDLERIGTAMYVTRLGDSDPSERARLITKLKPHVSYEAALKAVQEVDEFRELHKEGAT